MANIDTDAAEPRDPSPPILPPHRRDKARRALREFPSRSRRFISGHRKQRRLGDRKVSDRSRLGLDWMNFFIADVQMGFGSFLAFYLAGLGWSKEDVGLALSVGGLSGIIAFIPAGALVDALDRKRGIVTAGIVAIAVSAPELPLWPSPIGVYAAEVLHGVTAGVVGPAIAAISLGLAEGKACRCASAATTASRPPAMP